MVARLPCRMLLRFNDHRQWPLRTLTKSPALWSLGTCIVRRSRMNQSLSWTLVQGRRDKLMVFFAWRKISRSQQPGSNDELSFIVSCFSCWGCLSSSPLMFVAPSGNGGDLRMFRRLQPLNVADHIISCSPLGSTLPLMCMVYEQLLPSKFILVGVCLQRRVLHNNHFLHRGWLESDYWWQDPLNYELYITKIYTQWVKQSMVTKSHGNILIHFNVHIHFPRSHVLLLQILGG